MDSVNIKLKVGGVEIPSHPVFGDDVKVKVSKEEGQVFHRIKVDGRVKFLGSDFDFIDSCSHNEVLTLEVYRGSTFLSRGTFLKSDCTLNYDDKVCEVKLVATDIYEDFLANYDNKYNLPKLAPDIKALTLNKRPILQFYFLSDKKVTNAFGNMSFEVDAASGAEEKTEGQVLSCGFTKVFHWRRFVLPNLGGPHPSLAGIEGDYYGQFSSIEFGARVYRKDGLYYLEYTHYTEGGWDARFWQLYNADGTVFDNNGKIFISSRNGTVSTSDSVRIEYGSTFESTLFIGYCTENNRVCYGRVLSDYSESYTGETKVALSSISDDVAEKNYNYLYAWTVNTFDLLNHVIVSSEVQAEPTEYGVDGDGNYFVKPTPASVENAVYPIGWSMWIPISIWLETSPSLDEALRNAYNTTYQLQDAYPLHSAISKLLTAMGSNVVYADNQSFSWFFYAFYSRGLMDTLPTPALRMKSVYITPITNIKKTRYEQAAQRGDITLKQILDMLRNVYQCYWYINEEGKLCIEHISYFKGNKSYGLYTPTPIVDLTTMKDMPNGLPWGYGTNEVGFDRDSCPSRYEFAWGGECTEQFNGYAIDIKDKPAGGKNKEKVSVTNFVSDIDYAVINPSGLSDDIYAVVEAGYNDDMVTIENISLDDNSPVYSMQNGNLSFLFAERYFYPYDLGGWEAICNGHPLDVYAIRHFETQDIGVPLDGSPISIPADIAVIKTKMGVGLMKSADIDTSTMFAKTKLTLQTEKDDYRDEISVTKEPYSHGLSSLVIKNTSIALLTVQYAYEGNVVRLLLSSGERHIVAYGPSLEPSMITILSASPNKENNTPIGRIVQMYQSHMEVEVLQGSPSSIRLRFVGNHFGGVDFSYARVRLVKRARITITAHSETNYDVGYAASQPCANWFLIPEGSLSASGDGVVATRVFEAGQDVFVGYAKGYGHEAYGDYVVILIEDEE